MKNQKQDYVFIPRCIETIEKVKEDYKEKEITPTAPGVTFEAVREVRATACSKKSRERVKIYKDKLYLKDNPAEGICKGDLEHYANIHFTMANHKGAEYRKYDLEHDTEHAAKENDQH